LVIDAIQVGSGTTKGVGAMMEEEAQKSSDDEQHETFFLNDRSDL
jgi:hypothetical protein